MRTLDSFMKLVSSKPVFAALAGAQSLLLFIGAALLATSRNYGLAIGAAFIASFGIALIGARYGAEDVRVRGPFIIFPPSRRNDDAR